ncbi:MAG: hypothetical protein NTY07_06530 [Bacteroidia bacterium]|nr:hypothetical protein [Bacteroidia bacterium]
MKTTSHNAAKEIRIGILLVVFTMATFTAFKVKEIQVNDLENGELMRSGRIEVNQTGFMSLPVLDAKLIEEPVLEVEAWMNSDSYWGAETNKKAVEAELALQIEPLMKNTEYNAKEFVEAEMALEIENRMNSYEETNNEALEAELALQIEPLMKNTEYNAKEFVDAEMALEIQNRMNSNAGTNNEAVEAELALQIEPLMKNTEYNAKEFVEADMAIEIQSWMNNSEYWNMASK